MASEKKHGSDLLEAQESPSIDSLNTTLDESGFPLEDIDLCESCKHKIRSYMKKKPPSRKLKTFRAYFSKNEMIVGICLIPFVVANSLYISCNETLPCPEYDALACVFNFVRRNLQLWMMKVFAAAFIFCSLMLLPFYSKRRIFKFISLSAILNTIYLAGFYDNKITVTTYGQAFGVLLALCVTIILSSCFTFWVTLKLLKRKPIITLLALIIILFASSISFYYDRYEGSCNQWSKGLGGEEIDNSLPCKIQAPEVCVLDMLEGVIDLSFWDCSRYKADPEIIEKHYPKAPIIGLPRLEYAPSDARIHTEMQKYILDNSVGLENYEDPRAKDLEIFIDQRNQDDIKIVIDVKRNETLVQERAKLQDDSELSRNVLVIFTDSLSRARIFKKLPRTVAWLEKFYNKKSDKMESFQFFKFHSITPYTLKNELVANYGFIPNLKSPPPPPDEKSLPYVNEYISKGYITGRTSDSCTIALTLEENWLAYVKDIPFDHEGIPIACDPHHHLSDSPFGLFTGPFSMRRKCFYGQDTFRASLEYGNQFWRKYANEKKLLWMDFLDAHEATQESVTYLDEPLVTFLEGLERENLLDDTTIIFWSDHGNHMPFPPYDLIPEHNDQERALPLLFLVLPKRSFLPEHRANLKLNSQKLVSAYQVYYLLLTIPNGVNSKTLELSPLGDLPFMHCKDIGVSHQGCYCRYIR